VVAGAAAFAPLTGLGGVGTVPSPDKMFSSAGDLSAAAGGVAPTALGLTAAPEEPPEAPIDPAIGAVLGRLGRLGLLATLPAFP
jgi:hypothetical protein